MTALRIRPSPTADTRTCAYGSVTKGALLASSQQHIGDVGSAIGLFVQWLQAAANTHDDDKLSDIASFHADFLTGFREHSWWDRHRKLTRHHLNAPDGVPADVTLIDVLEFVADCVMAGMARSGSVYPLELPNDVLQHALKNTADALKREVEVLP